MFKIMKGYKIFVFTPSGESLKKTLLHTQGPFILQILDPPLHMHNITLCKEHNICIHYACGIAWVWICRKLLH